MDIRSLSLHSQSVLVRIPVAMIKYYDQKKFGRIGILSFICPGSHTSLREVRTRT